MFFHRFHVTKLAEMPFLPYRGVMKNGKEKMGIQIVEGTGNFDYALIFGVDVDYFIGDCFWR